MTEPQPAMIGEWYAAFFDGETRHWWWSLCHPGFRHVCAFGYDAEQRIWLLYDVCLARTHIRALTSEQMDSWVLALPTHRRILCVRTGADAPAHRLGFWCTTAVVHLLGRRSRALRPQALYRDLLAHGARPAFETEPQ